MALPQIKRTGEARTLTFSGDLHLDAKSMTANIATFGAGGIPFAWCGDPGKDRAQFSINYTGSLDPLAPPCDKTSIGGGDSATGLGVINGLFRITATLAQDWEHPRPYSVSESLIFNRPKYSLRLKVEIMSAGNVSLQTVFDTTVIEFDASRTSAREHDGSFDITIPVEQVLRWLPFSGGSPIPNPFDTAQHPSRWFKVEERISGPLTWDVTIGSLSTSGSRTFTPMDTNDPTIGGVAINDYGLTLSGSAGGSLIPGIPIRAEISNVVTANWSWAGYTGPSRNEVNAWAGTGGDYGVSGTVESDCAYWERVSPGDLLYASSSVASGNGLMVQYTGEGYYSTDVLDPSPPPGAHWDYVPGSPSISTGPRPVTTIRLSPPTRHKIEGVSKDFDDPYTQAVRYRTSIDLLFPSAYMTNSSGGTWGKTFTFQEVVAGNFVPPEPYVISRYASQGSFFYVELDGSHAATTFNEDGNDNRASFHTRVIDCLTAESVATILHDDFTSTAGWAASNASVSTNGSNVTITATGTATATRTYSPKLNTESKRFLRLRIMCNQDPKALQLELNGGKTWQFTTGPANEWTDIEIDTMLPNVNQGSGATNKDVRWPCDSLANDEPTQEAKHQGVNRVTTLKIIGLANGDILHIDKLEGYRKHWERLQYMNSDRRLDFPSGYPSSAMAVKRCALGQADGRQGLEMFGTRLVSSNYSILTCQEFIDGANKFNGWTWTRGGANILDSWNTDNITATEVGGGGWLWDGAAWVHYLRMDMSSPQTIKGTLLVDLIQFHPGSGDAHTTGAGYGDYTHEITVRCHHIFRGRAHGIVWNTNFEPVAGAPVNMLEPFNSNFPAGAGISDIVGYFETRPGARPYQYMRLFNGASLIGDIATFHSRRLHRTGGLAQAQSQSPWNMSTPDGPWFHLARTEGTGFYVYRRANHVDRSYGWAEETVVDADETCNAPRMIQDERRRIRTCYEKVVGYTPEDVPVYAAVACESWDDGRTFTEIGEFMDVPGIRRPTQARGEDGTIVKIGFLYNDLVLGTGPGTLKGTYQRLGDLADSAVFTLKDQAGVDLPVVDDQFHLSYDYAVGARWHLSVKIDGELSTSDWYSADYGQTWRRA